MHTEKYMYELNAGDFVRPVSSNAGDQFWVRVVSVSATAEFGRMGHITLDNGRYETSHYIPTTAKFYVRAVRA